MKKKTVVLVGIGVCLMLVTLLTSTVLASAGYSKIYGNANEDDTLDMRDVTYIKLVIFGKKPATAFADANYDGKISMLDIGQTKLIILGKEKKLTIVCELPYGKVVTINKPVERVVSLLPSSTRYLIALDAVDKLVGIGQWSYKWVYEVHPKAFSKLKELSDVGTGYEPNMELILSLEPHVVFAAAAAPDVCDAIQEKTGIPVVGLRGKSTSDAMFVDIKLLGIVLGKKNEGEDLISYTNKKIDDVTGVTLHIPDTKKPRVLCVMGSDITRASGPYECIDIAGGINVAGELIQQPGPGGVTVPKEQIIDWNPDIILVRRSSVTSKLRVEDVLSDPDLQTVNAVKSHKVYYTPGGYYLVGPDPPRVIIETFLMAKHFHPDKFEHLDVEKEGNEIFERFYGADGLWTELGTELGFI